MMAESAQSRLGRGQRDLHSKRSEKSCMETGKKMVEPRYDVLYELCKLQLLTVATPELTCVKLRPSNTGAFSSVLTKAPTLMKFYDTRTLFLLSIL